MTERQAAFVRHYVTNKGNGAQAAIAAGYSPRRAKETAARLVADGNIQGAIERRRREMEQTAGITRPHVLIMLVRLANEGDSSSARVGAIDKICKILGYYEPMKIEDVTQPPLQVQVHYVPARDGS